MQCTAGPRSIPSHGRHGIYIFCDCMLYSIYIFYININLYFLTTMKHNINYNNATCGLVFMELSVPYNNDLAIHVLMFYYFFLIIFNYYCRHH